MPRSHSATMPPVSASGTPLKTSSCVGAASRTLMNSSTKISSKRDRHHDGQALAAETSCSNCPPQSIQ